MVVDVACKGAALPERVAGATEIGVLTNDSIAPPLPDLVACQSFPIAFYKR